MKESHSWWQEGGGGKARGSGPSATRLHFAPSVAQRLQARGRAGSNRACLTPRRLDFPRALPSSPMPFSPRPTPAPLYRSGTWASQGPSSPASRRRACPSGSAEGHGPEGLGSAGKRGAEGPERPGTKPRMGTIEGGRWRGRLLRPMSPLEGRGPGKLHQDPPGPGLLGISPPRVGTWEPWQRGLYGGRSGPGGAAFPDSGGAGRGSTREDRGAPQPRPSPPPRPHLHSADCFPDPRSAGQTKHRIPGRSVSWGELPSESAFWVP